MSRMTRLSTILLLALALGTYGCSDDDGGTPDKSMVDPDGGGGTQDKGTTVKPTPLTCAGDCSDFVLSALLLPANQQETDKYSVDYTNDGKGDNALGGLLSGLSTIPGMALDPQASIDEVVNKGSTLMLMRIQGDLATAAAAKAQLWVAEEKACCPTAGDDPAACKTEAATTCFGGDAEFAKSTSSPDDMIFGGTITGGKMAMGPAKLQLTLPIVGSQPLVLNLQQVQMKGAITVDGVTEGVLAGLLPKKELDEVVLDAIAKLLDQMIKDDPEGSATLIALFDTTPKDGTITTQEVIDNQIIGAFLGADVDTDGDGTNDALSLGIGFRAVKASIVDGMMTQDMGAAKEASTSDMGMADDAAAAD